MKPLFSGPSPYLSNIDLYLDGKLITSVQGDGLIVSTPTGSTAYAVAAGASMIHPSVPAIMVTPICPHSLSFRPIVVPAGVELKVSWPKSWHALKGFVFYGVTFDLCRFCTFLNSAQLACWANFKNVQNLHKSNVTP